jgi:UDP-N-acetylmuramyl pentapeptide phosphotransferase/UDP-N-acetylglucosamine-1-phosphate transferase
MPLVLNMIGWLILAAILGCLASYASLYLLRRSGPADVPDARRLHSIATPRGGALGIAVIVLTMLCFVAAFDTSAMPAIAVMCGFAGLGACDDFKPQSASLRLAVQLVIALIAVVVLMPNAPIWLQAAAWFSCVAVVNMANFMDGSNGLLAILFVIFAGSAHALGLLQGDAVLLIGALFIGFIPFNFPSARMFMGDVGSYLIGAALAVALLQVLASWHTSSNVIALIKLTLLLLPITLDATLTIIWRALKRKPIWRAHREHLYQWLRRSGWSAQAIVLLYGSQAFALALVATLVDAGTLTWLLPTIVIVASALWFLAKTRILKLRRSSVARA